MWSKAFVAVSRGIKCFVYFIFFFFPVILNCFFKAALAVDIL
jgi:hypothetical protein